MADVIGGGGRYLLQRLAALVPRPRLHLIRFHGVLAPNAKLRAEIVPREIALDPNPGTSSGTSAAVATEATTYTLRAWPPQRRESRSCDSPNPKRHRTLARERSRNPLASGRD